jgi:uncharacterized protein
MPGAPSWDASSTSGCERSARARRRPLLVQRGHLVAEAPREYGRRVQGSLEVVKAWVAACNDGDADAALALCDSSMELVEAEALPGAVTATGIDAVRRYLERFASHWSEVQWLPQEFLESGDKVFVTARLRLRGRRSGIEVDREWIYVFTVRNGKLIRQDGFDERAEGLRAAGITAA